MKDNKRKGLKGFYEQNYQAGKPALYIYASGFFGFEILRRQQPVSHIFSDSRSRLFAGIHILPEEGQAVKVKMVKMYINMDKTPCYNLYFNDKINNGVF